MTVRHAASTWRAASRLHAKSALASGRDKPSKAAKSDSEAEAERQALMAELDRVSAAALADLPSSSEPVEDLLVESADELAASPTGERGGPRGPEPTRFGDWERKGRCFDF